MATILDKKNLATFLTHLLVIVILFVLPEVLTSLSHPWKPVASDFYVKAAVYVGVFYAEYYLILRRLPEDRIRWSRFAVWNVVMIAAVLFGFYLLFVAGNPHFNRQPKNPEHVRIVSKAVMMLSREFVMLVLTCALAVALKFGAHWRDFQARQREMQASQRQEELSQLKSQLNPHFLFNTLNSIYALIAISPEKAQEAVHELSRLLRYVLYESPAMVPLRQEVDFVKNYVELMKLRLSPKFPLEMNVNLADMAERQIAPLLFITLVENVFKHSDLAGTSPVVIDIKASGDTVSIATSNRVAATGKTDAEGGIGLANLRRRLDLLYGQRAMLRTETVDGRFLALLIIPLKES